MIEEFCILFFGKDVWGWGMFLLSILSIGLCIAMMELTDEYISYRKEFSERLETIESKLKQSPVKGRR